MEKTREISLTEQEWLGIKSIADDLGLSIAEFLANLSSQKLSGDYNLYRVRQGDYRVIYEIQDEVLLKIIVLAGHRKQIYRNL